MTDRLIDKRRLQAQMEQLQRITRGGEIDLEAAMRERRDLADRVENKRAAYIAYMKKMGWPQQVIDDELAEMDELLANLRTEPFSRQGLGIGGLGF